MPTFLDPHPIAPPTDTRRVLIQVFTTKEQKRALQHLALNEGTSYAAIVRELIEQRLKGSV